MNVDFDTVIILFYPMADFAKQDSEVHWNTQLPLSFKKNQRVF